MVVTGEGHMDWQSARGKVPSGVGKRCKNAGVPVVALVGGIGNGADRIYDFGINSISATVSKPMELEDALSRAEELYADAAVRMFRMIRVGMLIENKPWEMFA